VSSILDRLSLPGVSSPHDAIRVLERQRAILKARTSLMAFAKFVRPDSEDPDDVNRSSYINRPFHDAIADALEAFVRGEHPMLIFVMPPRHGKTELATKTLAAWYSGQFPEHNIAVGAYAGDIAADYGADVRTILQSQPFKQVFPDYKLKAGGKAKNNIQTERKGRLVFVGRGGPLTGRGAHMLLIDDLFKDYEEARSLVIRDEAWNWFTKVAMTRRMGKRLVCITMTRWHSDDVVGRLTDPENPHYSAAMARRWKIIRLPAIAEDDDPLGRARGEPLWPKDPNEPEGSPSYDLDFLEEQQLLDPLGFESLYQQNPTVADGVLFKRENVRYYDPERLPTNLHYYGASDHAVGLKQRNDKTCLLKGGVDANDDLYLTECIWQRMATDVMAGFMADMLGGPPEKRPLAWWAEKGHITMSVGPFLFKELAEQGIYPNIIDMTPASDKEQRAQSIAGRFARGKVLFPRGAPWVERAIAELMAFPNGTRDDFVDAFSWFGIGLAGMFRPRQRAVEEVEPPFGTLAWVKWMDNHAARERAKHDRGGF
jgi:predicted phage terminase large subunit-like protein